MSSGEVRKVSREDIQLVQNLIERCLQLYMCKKDVVNTLLVQAKIEPGFTELVWQKLEEENQDFFKAYHLRLIVKDQIMQFNRLLQRQVDMMRQIGPAGVASLPMSNGSHISTLHQNTVCYAPEHCGPALKAENLQHAISPGLRHTFPNGGSSLHPCIQNTVDVSSNMMLAQSGMIQGMNGGLIKSEAGYAGSSPYMFSNDGNVLEPRPAMGDASVSSFSSVESDSQPLNGTLVDADSSSFGFLGHIPRAFSFSDLTAHDIFDSYSGSPFLPADTDNILDHHGRVENQGDNKRLDTISEGLNYEDFGSD